MSDTISIVTVTYNCASVIESTIKSIISQDYKSIEYIVIDGGSKDGTLDIVKKYSDHIDILISEADKGIFDAMNKGIWHAHGKWINFMNAGDKFASDTILSEIFGDINSIKDVDVIFGDMFAEYGTGKKEVRLTPFYFEKGIRGMGFSHQSTFVRTYLAKNRPFDLSFQLSADYNMMWLLYYNDHAKFRKVDFPISCMISGEGATHENYKKHLEEVCRVCGGTNLERMRFIYGHILLRSLRNLKRKILLK